MIPLVFMLVAFPLFVWHSSKEELVSCLVVGLDNGVLLVVHSLSSLFHCTQTIRDKRQRDRKAAEDML